MYNYSSEPRDIKEKFRLMIREGQPGYWDARTELARINYTEKLQQVLGNHPVGRELLRDIKNRSLSDFKRVLKGEDDLWLPLYELEKHPENFSTILETIWNEWREDDMQDFLDDYISKLG